MFYDTILVNFTRGIKKMKKLLAITLAFMVFFSGCYYKTTEKRSDYSETFDEKIVSFMMKTDDKSFIIIGEKYQYIFEPNKDFEYLIQNLNEAYKFDIEKGDYTLYADNSAIAYFSIYIDQKNSSKDFIIWALKNKALQLDDRNILRLTLKMKGKFYLPNEESNKVIPKLDKEFKIKVKKEKLVDKEVTKSTPLTAPLIMVGTVIALPFLLTVMALGSKK